MDYYKNDLGGSKRKRSLLILKNIFYLLLFASFLPFVSAQKYQINDIDYNLDGRTKEYALNKTLDIRQDIVFESQEDLQLYINFISQKLNDQRVLENSRLDYNLGAENENGIIPVNLTIYAEETWNILPLPYPKYNSNTGLSVNFTIRDYNFLGLMKPFNFDFEFFQEDEGTTNAFGLGVKFSVPFPIGIFDAEWKNEADISYTFGDSKPEFFFSTGINITYAFRFITLQLEATQSVVMDKEYRETMDEFYLTEFLKFSTPITLLETTEFIGNIHLTPFTSVTYNWELDEIKHEDLVGPYIDIGYSFSLGKINWVGNFRKGFLTKFSHSYNYNFYNNQWATDIVFQFKGFTFFKAIGFSTQVKLFNHHAIQGKYSKTTNLGEWLRGVYDDERYNSGRSELPAGFIINLDFPIKIVQTDWRKWGKIIFNRNMPSWFSLFDFELQIAPFADIGLYKADDHCLFHLDDGFYTAGFEVIIFPSKMRSIQIRASAGMDLGARIFNQEWRTVQGMEIYLGVGFHY